MEELIIKHNPWWEGKEDVGIKKWKSMDVRWIPNWIKELSLTPFSLNFVTGPRQVGKTTGIKILIHQLLKKKDPESIFYFNCDFTPDLSLFKKIIDAYLEYRKSRGIKPAFIFLDEITSVPEWWRVIKGYIDLGVFENDVITITGSSSLKVKGETELFPGRRGKGKTVIVHPLSFREFLEVNGVNISPTGNLERDMKGLLKESGKISELFSSYVHTGGFPLSINKDPTAEEQLIAAFESEVLKARKSLQLMKEIISSIVRKTPSPLSFSTIGKDIRVSYKTVQDYVELLKNLFIMGVAFYKERKRVVWRKERKFFFLDPFVARALSLWCGEEYLESAFYEWLVQAHLLRKFGSVFYFRNSFEIDCIANEYKIEVKIGKPHRKYPANVLVIDLKNLPLFLSVIL